MIPVLTLLVISGFRWSAGTGATPAPTPTVAQKLISQALAATLPAELT